MLKMSHSVQELISLYEYTKSGYFFSKDSMRFFKSRVSGYFKRIDDVTAYFITTEKGPSGKRLATVHKAEIVESGGLPGCKVSVSTVGEFQGFTTVAAAKRWIEKEFNA